MSEEQLVLALAVALAEQPHKICRCTSNAAAPTRPLDDERMAVTLRVHCTYRSERSTSTTEGRRLHVHVLFIPYPGPQCDSRPKMAQF